MNFVLTECVDDVDLCSIDEQLMLDEHLTDEYIEVDYGQSWILHVCFFQAVDFLLELVGLFSCHAGVREVAWGGGGSERMRQILLYR